MTEIKDLLAVLDLPETWQPVLCRHSNSNRNCNRCPKAQELAKEKGGDANAF